MKKIGLRIALTFAVMFIIAFIIDGLYRSISLGESFFSLETAISAIVSASMYLMYLWISTRRYKLLTYLGVAAIVFLIICFEFYSEGVVDVSIDWVWKDTVKMVYYAIAFVIAELQIMILEECNE